MKVGLSIATAGACSLALLVGAACGDSSKPGPGDAAPDADTDGPTTPEASPPPADAGPGTSDASDAGADATITDASGTPSDAGLADAPGDGATRTCGNAFGAGPAATTTMHLDIGVHDPSMIWDGAHYYLFATGGTLGVRSSPDILTWSPAGMIFSAVPTWVTSTLGSTPTDLWAPDISYLGGQFHVYYAGSTFGSNRSVIGLATNTTLDPNNPAYAWVDQGLVLQSVPSDDYNAIDPSLTFDQNCAPWLTFGSFWSGIKLRKIDPASGMPATDDTTLYPLASRDGGAIEASSIIYHDGFFYLFVSFDACCQGVNSTYRTMVGRGSSITGPYTDKNGTDMMTGAAEQLLASEGRYIGPGGGTAFAHGSGYLYVYHYYDGDDGGVSKLQVRPVTFDANDWPVMGDPLFP
jgi:arabinan endo-1,5-alpha-L-arabinosidase